MKKIFLSLSLASVAFASNALNCEDITLKLDEQIQKINLQKTPNQTRLDYLQTQKDEINKNCVNGTISKDLFNQIKSQTKHDYENKKLQIEQEKLNKKQEKINSKKQKIEQKEAKRLEKLEKKQAKQKQKEMKKQEKEAKKQQKQNKQN